jgi:heme-degrading monooxygenase HmoA
MFVVLYEMKAKAGLEREFELAWADVTEAIYRVRGSLGSRLHKTQIERTYIAYAQWPSEDVFNHDSDSNARFTVEEKKSFERMKENSESVKILHRMNVCKDLWRPQASS